MRGIKNNFHGESSWSTAPLLRRSDENRKFSLHNFTPSLELKRISAFFRDKYKKSGTIGKVGDASYHYLTFLGGYAGDVELRVSLRFSGGTGLLDLFFSATKGKSFYQKSYSYGHGSDHG